jgi:O-antigen ligase
VLQKQDVSVNSKSRGLLLDKQKVIIFARGVIFLTLFACIFLINPFAENPNAGALGREAHWTVLKFISLYSGIALLLISYMLINPELSFISLPKMVRRFDYVDWLLTAFGTLTLPSLLVAQNRILALLGEPGRLDGINLFLGLAVWSFLVRRFFKRDEKLRKIFIPFLVTLGLMQALFVLAEFFNVGTLLGLEASTYRGVVGTIGHPGPLSAVLVFSTFLLFSYPFRWQPFVWMNAVMGFALGITQSRTTFLILFVLYIVALLIHKDRLRIVVSGVLVFSMMWVVVPLVLNILEQQSGKSRLEDEAVTDTNTLSTRLLLWRTATKCILRQPLLGGGSGYFRYCYPRTVPYNEAFDFLTREIGDHGDKIVDIIPGDFVSIQDSTLYMFQDGEVTNAVSIPIDKAHSGYLDVALNFGMPAMLIMLLFFLTPIAPIICNKVQERRLSAILVLPIVAVLIHKVMWFAFLETDILLWNYIIFLISYPLQKGFSYHIDMDV